MYANKNKQRRSCRLSGRCVEVTGESNSIKMYETASMKGVEALSSMTFQ